MNFINKLLNKIKSASKDNIISVIFLSAIPFWLFFIAPTVLKIPDNFSYKADFVSVDNFYDSVNKEFIGEQYSKTDFSYDVDSKIGNNLIIKNIFDVKSLNGKPIFKAEQLYGINPYTSKHVLGIGNKNRDGYLFAPRNLKKEQTFTYWHASTNYPLTMRFVSEETLYGLKVYKYEKSEKEALDQTEFMGFLPGVPETRGIKLASSLNMWVEPVSGYIVKMEDFSTDYYYYNIKTGDRLYPYNKFSNTYSEESTLRHVSDAKIAKNKVLLVTYYIPILFLILAFVIYFKKYRFFKLKQDFLAKNSLSMMVLFVILTITLISYFLVQKNINNTIETEFNAQKDVIINLIKNRTEAYNNILLGGRALFYASSDVNRSEWHNYVDTLKLEDTYPGTLGLGFAKVVNAIDKNNFIQSVRNEGFPNFLIKPEGNRSIYTPITYIEPFNEKNQKAFGFDMTSEEVRRHAVVQARDTGEVSSSGKVVLVQEENEKEVQSGFLTYLAVYKNHSTLDTVEKRKDNIYGYVYTPFRVNDLMQGIMGSTKTDLIFHIYDGLNINSNSEMYDSVSNKEEDLLDEKKIVYRKLETIYINNHPWTIEFINSPYFKLPLMDRMASLLTILVGLITSILVFILMFSLTRSRETAVGYADSLTKDLQSSVNDLERTKKAVLNVLEDVQDEKDKLARATTRLKLATESAQIGVWEWDVVKNILTWDDRMYQIYGTKKEDFNGAYEAWQKGLHPDDKKSGDDAIQAALKGEKDFSPQFRVVWPNGEIRYIQAYAIVERDSSGKPIKMVGVNLDITKESIVDRQKTEFVSLASHQLKTPIGSIQWDLEMLLAGDYGPVPNKQKEVLNEAYTMGKRMNDLVNALLNISRIEMGVFIIEPKPTDYIKLCEEVIIEMKPRLTKKGHKLVKDFDKNLNQIPADDKLLRIVYQNFISNAIKYTPNKGMIKISIKSDDKNITFSVANNGEPIPEGDQSRIFSKMFRASNAQEQDPDGNGLGLYVVKQIVENAGGKVWFTSKKGEDTVFACSFPLAGMKAKSGTKQLS